MCVCVQSIDVIVGACAPSGVCSEHEHEHVLNNVGTVLHDLISRSFETKCRRCFGFALVHDRMAKEHMAAGHLSRNQQSCVSVHFRNSTRGKGNGVRPTIHPTESPSDRQSVQSY